MNILVTGGFGYVGGRVVKYLSSRGHAVTGSSRSLRDTPEGWPSECDVIVLDPLDIAGPDIDRLKAFDVVLHLSAANEMRSADSPELAMTETAGGTRRLLEAACSAQVGRFIFMSTIHVYGALRSVITERTLPYPTHPYAISHRAGEDYVYSAHAAGRIQGVSVRLSNSIGAPAWPGVDRWSLVGNDMCRQAVETGEIIVKSPNQWRDFVAMSHVCRALELLLQADMEGLGDGLFNLTGCLSLQIWEIAEMARDAVSSITGREIRVTYAHPVDSAGDSPMDLRSDKLCAIGYSPSDRKDIADEILETARLTAKAFGRR